MRRPSLVRSMLVTCLLVLFAVLSSAAAEPGKVSRAKFAFDGQSVTYFLYQPKSVAPDARAPLLVLFHGAMRDGRVMLDEWKALADREGIILVAPNARNPRLWQVPADGPALICALVAELRKTLPVDPRRGYLFGHSAGAVFTLDMSMLESEYFAAAAFHAGAWHAADARTIVSYASRRIPIAGFVGDEDAFFPLADVQASVAALQQRQIPVDVEIIKGHDHNYHAIASRINESAWAALKLHALDRDPKYTAYLSTK